MNLERLPAGVINIILSNCSDLAKREFGRTCKKFKKHVFGDFVNSKGRATYTSYLWKHKIAVLKDREGWGLKQNPKNTLELFNRLNAWSVITGWQFKAILFDKTVTFTALADENFKGFVTGKKVWDHGKKIKTHFNRDILSKIALCFSDVDFFDIKHIKQKIPEFKIQLRVKLLDGFKIRESATLILLSDLLKVDQNIDVMKKIALQIFPLSRDSKGNGLLHLAAEKNNFLALKYLIEETAVPVNQVDSKDRTFLIRFVNSGGSLENTKKFMNNYGAKGNFLILCAAGAQRGEDFFNYFLEKFYQFAISDWPIENPSEKESSVNDEILKYSIVNKNILLAEMLLKKCKINFVEDKNKLTFLRLAVEHKSFELVKILLDNGAGVTINQVYRDYKTSLMAAVNQNCFEIVKLLIQNGANLHITDISGWTALLYAYKNQYQDIIELLLQSGASLNK